MPNDILLTKKITSLEEIVESLDEVGCRYSTNDIMIKTADCIGIRTDLSICLYITPAFLLKLRDPLVLRFSSPNGKVRRQILYNCRENPAAKFLQA